MEGLADELVLDTELKGAFFAGDALFEIARWLEETAAPAAISADGSDHQPGGRGEAERARAGGLEVRQVIVGQARRLSAVAHVLSSAFFHSLEIPRRLDLVTCPRPIPLPAIASLLVTLSSRLRHSLSGITAELAQNEMEVSTTMMDRVVGAVYGMDEVKSSWCDSYIGYCESIDTRFCPSRWDDNHMITVTRSSLRLAPSGCFDKCQEPPLPTLARNESGAFWR